MVTLDLNILPIHRINGQASAEIPGLLAVTPPRKTARGREQNTLIAYLTLSGNAPFSNSEIRQLVSDAATLFYQSTGSLTFAMRTAANDINSKLLARNLAATGQGQQAWGLLVLAALRDATSAQCTLLLSGPTHAVWVTDGGSRHIHDPVLSGKGLGLGQSVTAYLSQVELHPQDLLVLCSNFPRDWEADLLNERPPASLDASYRKLTFAKGDLNAVLIQAQSGHGTITLLRPDVSTAPQALQQPVASPSPLNMPVQEQAAQTLSSLTEIPETAPPLQVEAGSHQEPEVSAVETQPQITEEELDSLAGFAAHMVQPSAYAIPPQSGNLSPVSKEETKANGTRGFPASIPRAQPVAQESELGEFSEVEKAPTVEEEPVKPSPPARAKRKRRIFKSNAHAEATRQMAKAMVGGIRSGRHVNERFRAFLQKFIPRLLPVSEKNKPLAIPAYLLVLIALIIPVSVSVVSWMVYERYGVSQQYQELYTSATLERARALSETDPSRQRDAWQRVLNLLKDADEYHVTDESNFLRTEAQSNLDALMGVIRLEFVPAFPNGLGGSASLQISHLAASESDLYMLSAEDGRILHAAFTGRSLELDNAFNCRPGSYGGYQVGKLIDILALPKVNALGATVLGIDANGNLLYCAPDQVAQALPLPSLPNTNWGRITAFALENDSLYILDAQSHAVWVFPGKDASFTDTPYFYFSNEIPPNIDSAIDLAVSNDDLYMLHTDGHLSTCTFSRLTDVPTRCQDPAPRVDNYPAHQDVDIFNLAHFTQLAMTNPPNSLILLLDSANQSVFRFSPRSFELQNQVSGFAGTANPFQRKSVTAMAVSPNYVLYLAIDDQVYFATNLP